MAALEDSSHLLQLVEDLRRCNADLQAETEVFEWYISNLHLHDLNPQHISESLDADAQEEMGGHGEKPEVQKGSQESPQKLTLQQRGDVAQSVSEMMRGDLEKLRKSSETMAYKYKASTEEADTRLAEIKKANYEFDRDVVKRLQKENIVSAEKILHYTEDRIKSKDTLIEKLRQKNSALCAQKLKQQLQHDRQTGEEKLHEVDVLQMKVENSQYIERLQERNRDMMRLKVLAGNTLQVLNSYKKKLDSTTHRFESLNKDIASRKELLVKTEVETLQAEEERAKAEAPNRRLRAQLADFRAPPVLEYVTTQASHTQLQQNVKSWERKVEIAEMSLKMHTKTWNKLCTSAGASNK